MQVLKSVLGVIVGIICCILLMIVSLIVFLFLFSILTQISLTNGNVSDLAGWMFNSVNIPPILMVWTAIHVIATYVSALVCHKITRMPGLTLGWPDVVLTGICLAYYVYSSFPLFSGYASYTVWIYILTAVFLLRRLIAEIRLVRSPKNYGGLSFFEAVSVLSLFKSPVFPKRNDYDNTGTWRKIPVAAGIIITVVLLARVACTPNRLSKILNSTGIMIIDAHDPDYVDVYVSKTSTKYHCDAECSNGNYERILLREAIDKGYAPCKKCVPEKYK